MAPAVLAAYKRPPARPRLAAAGVSARMSTGRVPPIKNAGSPTSTKGNSQANRPTCSLRRAKGPAATLKP
ncbi:hypothetical protein D3C75_1206140 [compost metagenome]